MGVAVWIGLGVAVWLTLATVTAVLVGRVLSRRDAQVPADATPVPVVTQDQRSRA